MDDITSKEWLHKKINIRNIENREFITARATFTQSKRISIRISIGLVVCELFSLEQGNRVEIYLNKKDRNIFLIRKSLSERDGYKLNYSKGSNYLTFDFICNFNTSFKIKQTLQLDYDFNKSNIILDMAKLRWEK